jgi:hypothetical protein
VEAMMADMRRRFMVMISAIVGLLAAGTSPN